jgi:hypothetical protein
MSRKEQVFHFPCNPNTFGGDTTFQVTVPKQGIYIKPKTRVSIPFSLGSEVDRLVTEWYMGRGMAVPPEELVGAQIDAAEAAESARIEAAAVTTQADLPSIVPDFGTPEFWAYHRAKKAAENKRRAEAGLPPLPTKKELEAEKAKRKAEREAKKAAKASKGT